MKRQRARSRDVNSLAHRLRSIPSCFLQQTSDTYSERELPSGPAFRGGIAAQELIFDSCLPDGGHLDKLACSPGERCAQKEDR